MKHIVPMPAVACPWPDLWQMMFIALCALILCSCRSPSAQYASPSRGAGLPAEAYTGASETAMAACPMGPPGMEQGVPLPYEVRGPWAPSGLRQPWPADEYLRDGGDEGLPTGVRQASGVMGLEMEDAVAHYDTLDGRTLVEPSNEVYLYAPRFGAVRHVVGLVSNVERQKAGGVDLPEKLDAPTTLQIVGSAKQNIQPTGESDARPPVALRSKQARDVLSTALGPKSFQSSFQAYENLAIIRRGVMEMGEKAYLAQGSTAAITWSNTQAVQILLEHQNAMAEVKYDQAMSVYTIDSPPGNPKLRVVKVASTPFAKPGETVDFTIRVDNIGNQPVNRVTILDSLNTRLEYIEGSAQCSLGANFSTQPNEGGSLVVRCELSDILEPGQGGILRFRCHVR